MTEQEQSVVSAVAEPRSKGEPAVRYAPTMTAGDGYEAGQRWVIRLGRFGIVRSHAEMWAPSAQTYWSWEPHRDWFVTRIWPTPTKERIVNGAAFYMFARRQGRSTQ